jgi:CHRD domain
VSSTHLKEIKQLFIHDTRHNYLDMTKKASMLSTHQFIYTVLVSAVFALSFVMLTPVKQVSGDASASASAGGVTISTGNNGCTSTSTGGASAVASASAGGCNFEKFSATLTGSEEVPAKNTRATGSADFQFNTERDALSYKLSAMDINKATMAHIHEGKVGTNGPIVVTLFKSAIPSGPINGILSQGIITSDRLEGPLGGKQITDLVKIINEGNAYVNIHTVQNPNGEIRGQISSP